MPTLDNLELFHALAQIAERLEHVRDACDGAMRDALDALVLTLDQCIDQYVDATFVREEE
jgi:hypothetical protein